MTDKEIEALMKKQPRITKKLIKQINSKFVPYLFYETTGTGKSKTKHFTCTSCNKNFDITAPKKGLKKKLYDTKHNDLATCPHCATIARVLNSRKLTKYYNQYEYLNFAWFVPAGYSAAWIICFSAYKDYRVSKDLSALKVTPRYVYYISETGSRKFEYSYWWCESRKVHEMKSLNEPFECYHTIDFNRIKETFLKYSALEETKRINSPCRYLALYPTHRPMEMLVKTGNEVFVEELVTNKREIKSLINWNATSGKDVFKFPKEHLQFINTSKRWPGDGVKRYEKYKKCTRTEKITIEQFSELESLFIDSCRYDRHFEKTIRLCRKNNIPIRKVLNYIKKVDEKARKEIHCAANYPGIGYVLRHWLDYTEMGITLGYDFSQEIVLFPKNLSNAHDTATQTMNAIKLEKEKQRLKDEEKRSKRRFKKRVKQYAYENDTFAIVVPKELIEIVSEGQVMQHCVGGYTTRHANGTLTILFLRNKAEIDKPLYTIEMRDKIMCQVQGFKNRTPLTPEAKAFFDEWLEWVKAGSPRNKDGTPKELKKTDAA